MWTPPPVLRRVARRVGRRGLSVGLALRDHGAVHQASAIAFSLFLGLIPLASLCGWLLAKFAGQDIRDQVLRGLVAIAPDPTVRLVDEQLRRFIETGDAIAPLSLVGFLWIASGGAHTAMVGIQVASDGIARPWWENRLRALAFVGGLLVFVGIVSVVLVTATPMLQVMRGHVPVSDAFFHTLRLGTLPISLVLTTTIAAGFFRLASPHPELLGRRRIVPGALVTSLGWAGMSWMFTLYVRYLGRFSVFYGSLAAVALLLLWLWMASFLLLVGSEVNLQMQGSRPTILPTRLPWTKVERGPKGLGPTSTSDAPEEQASDKDPAPSPNKRT